MILVPPIIEFLRQRSIDIHNLRWIDRYPEKHVIWDVSDDLSVYPDLKDVMFLRCTLTKEMMQINPRSRAIAWPAKDLSEQIPVDKFEYDITFRGWSSCETRADAARSCSEHLNADIVMHPKFFGYIEGTEEGDRRRQQFLDSLQKSRLVLAPPSIYKNCFPYRFFEAMSAARMPVMVGSGQVYPFPNKIPWNQISIQIHESRAKHAGEILKDILEGMSDEEVIHRGRQARRAWETWLDSRHWPRLHRILVEEML